MISKVQYKLTSLSGYSYPGYPGMVPEEKDKIVFKGRIYPNHVVEQDTKTGKLNIIA